MEAIAAVGYHIQMVDFGLRCEQFLDYFNTTDHRYHSLSIKSECADKHVASERCFLPSYERQLISYRKLIFERQFVLAVSWIFVGRELIKLDSGQEIK